MELLPAWLHCCLWGNQATYAILKDTVNDLNDWGLLVDVHQYRQFDQDNMYLIQKLDLLEVERQSIIKNHAIIKECLVSSRLTEKVKHLALHLPLGTIQSGWKRRSPLKSPRLFQA